jgi:hypothetical protein
MFVSPVESSDRYSPWNPEAKPEISDLPDELIYHIFHFLSQSLQDATTFMQLLRVNRRFKCLACTESLVKRITALAMESGWKIPQNCQQPFPLISHYFHVQALSRAGDLKALQKEALWFLNGTQSEFHIEESLASIKKLAGIGETQHLTVLCLIEFYKECVDKENQFDAVMELIRWIVLADFPGYEFAEINYNLALVFIKEIKEINHFSIDGLIQENKKKAEHYLKQTIRRVCHRYTLIPRSQVNRAEIKQDPYYAQASYELVRLGMDRAEIENLAISELDRSKESLPPDQLAMRLSDISSLEKYGFRCLCMCDPNSAVPFFHKASRLGSFKSSSYILHLIKTGAMHASSAEECQALLSSNIAAALSKLPFMLAMPFSYYFAQCLLGRRLNDLDVLSEILFTPSVCSYLEKSNTQGLKYLEHAADGGLNRAGFQLAFIRGDDIESRDLSIFYLEGMLKDIETRKDFDRKLEPRAPKGPMSDEEILLYLLLSGTWTAKGLNDSDQACKEMENVIYERLANLYYEKNDPEKALHHYFSIETKHRNIEFYFKILKAFQLKLPPELIPRLDTSPQLETPLVEATVCSPSQPLLNRLLSILKRFSSKNRKK